MLSGATRALLRESRQADRDITARLYDDYRSLREKLIRRFMVDNPGYLPETLIHPAQKLLDRMLFIAFAEDKALLPANTFARAYEHRDPYNPRPVFENFKGLFSAIDRGNEQLAIPAYNGGLFRPDPLLEGLKVGDELCHAFKLLGDYDFDSEVSVTVLGHIFEQSINDLEQLGEALRTGAVPERNEKARAVSGKRKQYGVVYTPDHITAFIVEQALGGYLDRQFDLLLKEYGTLKSDGGIRWKRGRRTELRFWYAWQERLKNVRVVDPACGSGAFLVAAFDYLSVEYRRVNEKLAELTGQHSVFDLDKTILNDNLYGVDINAEAIEISKLSLWLKTARKGKPLTDLDRNLVAGNSLGVDEVAPESDFVWRTAFPEVFAAGGFDVVLGNPPYVRMELLKPIKPWLQRHFAVVSDRADLYAYFYEVGIRLLRPGGRLGFISSSTFFKTGSGAPLRRFLGEQANLLAAVDFGDLQVFEGVTTYPAILVLEKRTPRPDH
ncbi:MAG: N-6 DNA methylase, partial [Pseudomonadota bacterium]|nr:N-6 DNA methylase [Pseudomonadota bacterium]